MPRFDLAALSARYDAESEDAYLSLYADRTDDRLDTRIDARSREIRAVLDRDAEERFDRELEAARKALRGLPKSPGGAVFVSLKHGFTEAHDLAAPIETRLVLDSSPYVRPLARFADEYESFVLVMLDGAEATVHLVDAGRAERVDRATMDLIGRHRKGGMSQARYQRHRQGRVDALFDEIAATVERLLQEGEAQRVILAGPGNPKRQFLARLSRPVAEKVVAVQDADFQGGERDTLIAGFVDLARALEAKASGKAVEVLRAGLLRGELAMTGPFEVARAARDGQVELLVILKGHTVAGAKCEEHQSFFPAGQACACGSKGTRVDLINEAIEYATRADTRVEFVGEAPFLRDVGGVGALLRW